jgi:hypothetical protein
MVWKLAFTFGTLAVVSFAQAPNCMTPLGNPCYTLHGTRTSWQLFEHGLTDIREIKANYISASGRDGSHVDLEKGADSALFERHTRTFKTMRMYVGPKKEIITVDYHSGTLARREPLIWHDVPYRRARAGDATCESGIRHYGTDFQIRGAALIAGLPTVKWHRDLANGSEEEYLAPSLDCIALKTYMVVRNRAGIPIRINNTQVSRVEFGEPNPNVFKLPASGLKEITDPNRARLLHFIEQNGNRKSKI